MVEKYKRITGKLFGETATATGINPEIAQFGSALEGSYRATTDVEVIQSLSAWSKGFIQAVTPETQFPALPEVTGLIKVLSYHINYLLQSGFPEWDSMTTYYTNNYCRVGNRIFYSLTDNNQNINPLTDNGTNWFETMKEKKRKFVSSIQTVSNTTNDLSSYLPDDDNDYLVWVVVYRTSQSGSVTVQTDIFPNTAVATTDSDAGRSSRARALVTVPVSVGRTLTIKGSNSSFLEGYLVI